MSIRNVKVKLDGIDLQVNTNGVQPHRIVLVDEAQSWLSRDKLAATREDDDSIGFDVTVLSGKRLRVRYGPAVSVTVPQNNNSAIDSLYRKVKKFGYDITGTGMTQADALHFYAAYNAAQTTWALRAKYMAQLADPDITISVRNGLISALQALSFDTMPLIMNGTTYNVFFDEGQSCQFTDWVVTEHTDFRFSLVILEYI